MRPVVGRRLFYWRHVDDRVQFASPVNMVSAIMQGGDLCENAPGLRLNTSNVEIAAMFAPKPMLLVSATGDWTHNVPKEEYPAIRRIYDLYGKGDQVEVVLIDAPHNFNELSREAVYRFFAKHNPGLSDSRELIEHDISVPALQDMLALSNRTLPANDLDLDGVFRLWQDQSQARNNQIQDRDFLRERLRQTLAVEVPEDVIADRDGRSIVLGRPGKGDRVPAFGYREMARLRSSSIRRVRRRLSKPTWSGACGEREVCPIAGCFPDGSGKGAARRRRGKRLYPEVGR